MQIWVWVLMDEKNGKMVGALFKSYKFGGWPVTRAMTPIVVSLWLLRWTRVARYIIAHSGTFAQSLEVGGNGGIMGIRRKQGVIPGHHNVIVLSV